MHDGQFNTLMSGPPISKDVGAIFKSSPENFDSRQLASEAVARQLKVTRGAMVQAVAPNSAAAKTGLLPTRRALSGIVAGDVITALDARPVTKPGLPILATLPVHVKTCDRPALHEDFAANWLVNVAAQYHCKRCYALNKWIT